MRGVYDVEDMVEALENSIEYLRDAGEELHGIIEYEDQEQEIVSVRKELEDLLGETLEIMQKIWEEERKELEREFFKSRL